jgi:hypothetical protein
MPVKIVLPIWARLGLITHTSIARFIAGAFEAGTI